MDVGFSVGPNVEDHIDPNGTDRTNYQDGQTDLQTSVFKDTNPDFYSQNPVNGENFPIDVFKNPDFYVYFWVDPKPNSVSSGDGRNLDQDTKENLRTVIKDVLIVDVIPDTVVDTGVLTNFFREATEKIWSNREKVVGNLSGI